MKGLTRFPANAPLVSRLTSAGAIVLGNTTVPEFPMAWETEAAAVASCCSAGGIGSDGGGSIRLSEQDPPLTAESKTVEYLDAFSYSQCFNPLGNPAAVVPIGRSSEGLPIGVQIVGRPWEEERVLAISNGVEQAGGWKEPPLE